jgi:hypothetical protein
MITPEGHIVTQASPVFPAAGFQRTQPAEDKGSCLGGSEVRYRRETAKEVVRWTEG